MTDQHTFPVVDLTPPDPRIRIAVALERIASTMEKQTALALASSQMGSEMMAKMMRKLDLDEDE